MIDSQFIDKLIFELKSSGKIKSMKDLAAQLPYNYTYLSQMKTGVEPISEEFVNKVKKLFPEVFEDLIKSNKVFTKYLGPTEQYKFLLEKWKMAQAKTKGIEAELDAMEKLFSTHKFENLRRAAKRALE